MIIRGNLIYTKDHTGYTTVPHGYIVVDEKGVITGVYEKLPEGLKDKPIRDYGECLIIPGFTDCHFHPAQYPQMGISYNKEMMVWCNDYTIPQECRMEDADYARKVYSGLVQALWRNGILHSIMMATQHLDASLILFDLMKKSGLRSFVGHVCMDQSTSGRTWSTTEEAIALSEEFIQKTLGQSELVKPILTASLSVICTRELMTAMGEQARKYNLPMQGHLGENMTEVQRAIKRYPDCETFADTYDKAGMFGGQPTMMAHCVYLTEKELKEIKERNILVAHCPNSNYNLLSGIMPFAKYLDEGVRVGIGSDISGGSSLNMFENMKAAVQQGAVRVINHSADRPVMACEAFYAATKGGGSFFGKTGSFEPGYDFDVLVVDDTEVLQYNHYSLEDRADKLLYCADDRNIKKRFVKGREIPEPEAY